MFVRPNLAPDLAGVADRLAASGCRLGHPLVVQDETESTNDDAKRGAKGGEPHGATWLAETQTKGRGRQGRTWTSPKGENLLFSVLFRVRAPSERIALVSLAAGLAVRDAVARAVGDDAAVLVKWPNDVLVRRPGDGVLRKVAGILVESSISGTRVEHVVIGVGMNVHTRAFPDELADTATSVALERSARGAVEGPDRGALLADVLAGLDRDVEHVVHRGLGLIHARLSKHDAFAGREVEATTGDVRGVAAGIDPDGRLLVRRADGSLVHVASGEMRIRAV